MIKSFRHKGLEQLYYKGTKKGINPKHVNKILRILDRLDASVAATDMNLPGYNLHRLSGKESDIWSVWVSGNWRLTFKFEGEDVILVDYMDYH